MKRPLDSRPAAVPSASPTDESSEQGTADRRPYERPQVMDHGRLVDVALGGSPGVGDSGSALIQKPPGQ